MMSRHSPRLRRPRFCGQNPFAASCVHADVAVVRTISMGCCCDCSVGWLKWLLIGAGHVAEGFGVYVEHYVQVNE